MKATQVLSFDVFARAILVACAQIASLQWLEPLTWNDRFDTDPNRTVDHVQAAFVAIVAALFLGMVETVALRRLRKRNRIPSFIAVCALGFLLASFYLVPSVYAHPQMSSLVPPVWSLIMFYGVPISGIGLLTREFLLGVEWLWSQGRRRAVPGKKAS